MFKRRRSRPANVTLREQFSNFEIRGQLKGDLGAVVDPESHPILTNLFRAAIEPTREKVEWQGIRPNLRQDEYFPHVILRLNGCPEAFTKPSGQGSVTIFLGGLVMLTSFPRLVSMIESFCQNDTYEIKSLLNFKPPKEVIDEVFSFLAMLYWCDTSDWTFVPWSEEKANTIYVTRPPVVLNVARLISWHEVAHWHMERLMTDHGRTHFESQTESDVKEWLSQRNPMDPDWDPKMPSQCGNALEHPEISRSWIREICADQLGTSAALTAAGAYNNPHTRRELYVAIAMYFFSLELVELYEFFKYRRNDYTIHPAAQVRRSVTTYILRKKTRLPEKEFVPMEWGAGLSASFITREIVSAVARRIMEDPGSEIIPVPHLPWDTKPNP